MYPLKIVSFLAPLPILKTAYYLWENTFWPLEVRKKVGGDETKQEKREYFLRYTYLTEFVIQFLVKFMQRT